MGVRCSIVRKWNYRERRTMVTRDLGGNSRQAERHHAWAQSGRGSVYCQSAHRKRRILRLGLQGIQGSPTGSPKVRLRSARITSTSTRLKMNQHF